MNNNTLEELSNIKYMYADLAKEASDIKYYVRDNIESRLWDMFWAIDKLMEKLENA